MAREEVLTVPQLLEELGINRATYYRWRAIGKGPKALKLPNGQIRIRRSALNAFLDSCDE